MYISSVNFSGKLGEFKIRDNLFAPKLTMYFIEIIIYIFTPKIAIYFRETNHYYYLSSQPQKTSIILEKLLFISLPQKTPSILEKLPSIILPLKQEKNSL